MIALELLKRFPINQYLRVTLDGQSFRWAKVTGVVPKGSKFRLLLSVLGTNDLSNNFIICVSVSTVNISVL